jgi:hypothetical protein
MLGVPEMQGMASLINITDLRWALTKKKIPLRTQVTTASLLSKMRRELVRNTSAR